MSDASLFSEHWYRIRDLKPKLAGDIRVTRQLFRGLSSHLLHRSSTNQYHRIDSVAWDLVARFDGHMTVGEIWEASHEIHGAQAPTQPDVMRLLSTLHESDLIVVDRKLDAERLFRRSASNTRRANRQKLVSPLYLRFKLCNPDRVLTWLEPRVRPLLGRTGVLLWFAVVLAGLVQMMPHGSRLLGELTAFDAFAPLHLGVFLVTYTLMKLLHELAHALVIKHFGGEVHEFGLALMVLLPNPYTDASAATMFPGKYQRMLVSAAGIGIELCCAGIGALFWVNSSGLASDIGLIMLLTGGVSTLFFNGNPLLKFDGYYVLADWLEIPNLAERSRHYLLGKLASGILGLPDNTRRPGDHRERLWLIGYGLLSTAYRIALMASIAWMLSGKYFFFGALLACYVIFTMLVQPLYRLIGFIHALPPGARTRSTLITGALFAGAVVLAVVMPLPNVTVVDGVVWLPDNAIVRVEHGCEVVDVRAEPGARVSEQTPLLRCEDVELQAQRRSAAARVRELLAQKAGLSTTDPSRYQSLRRELENAEAALGLIDQRINSQLVHSEIDGQFLVEDQQQLLGRYFTKGEIVGFVVPARTRTIRVALTQAQIGRVNHSTEQVEIVPLQRVGSAHRTQSKVVRQTPKPNRRVVSRALTQLGGGELPASEETDGVMLTEPAYDVELDWPNDARDVRVGGAVRVKFTHDAAPLATRVLAELKRAFMGRVNS